MKTIIVLSCLVAVSMAASIPSIRILPALRHEEVHDEFGQYAFRYITAENTVVSERGRLVPNNKGGYVMEIEGQYEYVGDDDRIYITKYKGGPGGFQVIGDHLPVNVPMPGL
ncbi:hypothetical protein NE865_02789 [Phthorimaea operculella]|nr:hypothetical protein NE865_02789 [Phthorimaea operculella]